MQYAEAAPSPFLAPYVRCFWALEYKNTGPAEPEPVIPDGCIEIIFNLSDRFRRYHPDGSVERQASSLIAGQMHASVLIGPSGNVDLFGIRFHPSGAHRFMPFEMNELADRIDPLEAVLGNSVALIEDHLATTPTFEGRVAIAEAFLAGSLTAKRSDHNVEHALAVIGRSRGTAAVSSIAREVGISERSLERAFRRCVGTTPKAFSRVIRFQNVLREIEHRRGDVLDSALELGYYDQSHLINDFNQFSGSTPKAFFERSRQMTDIFIPNE